MKTKEKNIPTDLRFSINMLKDTIRNIDDKIIVKILRNSIQEMKELDDVRINNFKAGKSF